MAHAVAIRAALDEPGPGTLLLEREYFSQSIDTAAFELDNGNGWFDASAGAVHLVAATQSPHEVAEDGARMLAASRFGVKRLVVHPCYTVGYGSKDHCPFPFYALTASLYGDGRPVRLANDRYEQFQSSLKRHSFRIRYRLAVDRDSGKFTIFQGDMTGDGGGRQNFSPSVCLVAATAAQSIYYFPRSDLASTVISSRALDAGSARGYGTLQSMGATEMLVDEAAAELRMDPIELRQRNVFASGMKNTQGAIPGGALRADEVLARCRSAFAVAATRDAQARIRGGASGQALRRRFRLRAEGFRHRRRGRVRRSRAGARRAGAAAPGRHRHGHGHGHQPGGVVRPVARQAGRRSAHRRDRVAGTCRCSRPAIPG